MRHLAVFHVKDLPSAGNKSPNIEEKHLLTYLGLTQLSDKELFLLLLLAICVSMILGWIMDLIMRNVGFGVFGNSFVSLLGIATGLAAFHYFYRAYDLRTTPITLLFVVCSIMGLLVLLSWLSRILKI
jgi:uncharacterized membrane protein YeaQ/YmgE (transglycosylase-associated protein family)